MHPAPWSEARARPSHGVASQPRFPHRHHSTATCRAGHRLGAGWGRREGGFVALTVLTNNSLCKRGTCSTPDCVLGTGVPETKLPGSLGNFWSSGGAVREESDGPQREGQRRGRSCSEDAGVRGLGTSWRKGNACHVQVSRYPGRVLLQQGMGAGFGEEVWHACW